MSSSGARRTRSKAALVAGGVLLALVAGEVVCRIDALFPGARYDRASARSFFEVRSRRGGGSGLSEFIGGAAGVDATEQHPMPHPWSAWSNPAETALIDAQVAHARTAEGELAFDVVVVGGSVAAQIGGSASAPIAERLGAHASLQGRPVRVWNHASAAYKAPQSANLVAWLVALDARPDAVIVIDGFNEVAIARSNASDGVHPLHPFLQYWTPVAKDRAVDVAGLEHLVDLRAAQRVEERFAGRCLDLGVHHSGLATRLALRMYGTRHRAYLAAADRYRAHVMAEAHGDVAVSGPRFDPAPPAVIDAAVRGWALSARALHALCEDQRIPLVHALQPTLHDRGSKPLTSEEVRVGGSDGHWIEGAREGYPKLREAAAELARDGVAIVDATKLFEEDAEAIYIDVCHYNQRGRDLVAKLLGDALAARVR